MTLYGHALLLFLLVQNVDSPHFTCVPHSCCFGANVESGRTAIGAVTSVSTAFGRCSFQDGTCPESLVLTKVIYTRGCLEILNEMYDADLVDLMLVYGVGGTGFILVELVAVALAFAYSAQVGGGVTPT